MNDEKRYPEIDEEDGSCMMASESEYGATAVVGADTDVLDDDVVYGVAPGTFGFYTDDPKEFRRHVEEMEAEINDPGTKWMSSEDVWKGAKINKNFNKRKKIDSFMFFYFHLFKQTRLFDLLILTGNRTYTRL